MKSRNGFRILEKCQYSQYGRTGEIFLIRQQTWARASAARRTRSTPQFEGFVTDLILPDAAAKAPRPQAFLVEQSANWTLPTHFHQEHQFQLFVAGGGTLGRNPVERLAVHYASPHSGYGPLISGDEGISYFTLRAVGDTGAWYLPKEREHLQLRIKKQQMHAAPSDYVSAEQLASQRDASMETLIAPDVGGLAAWLLRIPAGARAAAPERAEDGGGRFYVVTQGSLQNAGEELTALSTLFVSSDDHLDHLQAGANGLEVMVLQFPVAAAASFIEAMASPAPIRT